MGSADAYAELLKLGPLGIVVAVQAAAIYKLWLRCNELQDARVEDAKRAIPVLENVTDAVEKLAETNNALKAVVEARSRR